MQLELAELSHDLQTHENLLNRNLQRQLVELNQEFQTQQGSISRDFAEKVEIFKAELQKYFFQEQRELQLQLKAQDIALARELREYDRQTAISVIQAQIRQNNSPIWLVAEDLLNQGSLTGVLPLHVFLSPPVIKNDHKNKDSANTKGFPEIEQYLQEELRRLFERYQTHARPIDYHGGAWKTKEIASEAAAHQISIGLKSEPTLILESILEGEKLSISLGYWGLGTKQRYKTLMSFSWWEALYDFIKQRTETWFHCRAEEGTSEAEWIAKYGEKFVRKYQANQAMMVREQEWQEWGEDIREIPDRTYNPAPRDWENLKQFVSICHCAIAGWIADEYFLLDASPDCRQQPLLPDLMPELLSGMSEAIKQQFIDASTLVYQNLYQRLLGEIPDWEPELRLELAASLIKLPNLEAGREEINASLAAWLKGRGINWQPSTPVIPLLAEVAKPEDEGYFHTLHQAWQSIDITDEVDMGSAYHRRGEDFFRRGDYGAAIADFDRALSLGYGEAAVRKQEVESELNRPKYQAIERFK